MRYLRKSPIYKHAPPASAKEPEKILEFSRDSVAIQTRRRWPRGRDGLGMKFIRQASMLQSNSSIPDTLAQPDFRRFLRFAGRIPAGVHCLADSREQFPSEVDDVVRQRHKRRHAIDLVDPTHQERLEAAAGFAPGIGGFHRRGSLLIYGLGLGCSHAFSPLGHGRAVGLLRLVPVDAGLARVRVKPQANQDSRIRRGTTRRCHAR
jgi:hypothetical protein